MFHKFVLNLMMVLLFMRLLVLNLLLIILLFSLRLMNCLNLISIMLSIYFNHLLRSLDLFGLDALKKICLNVKG